MWILESARGIATTVFIFIALAIITGFISANVRVFASNRGFDTYLHRLADHPQIAAAIRATIEWYRRIVAGWQPLRQRWWLWLALGLSGGIAASLWMVPTLPTLIAEQSVPSAPPLETSSDDRVSREEIRKFVASNIDEVRDGIFRLDQALTTTNSQINGEQAEPLNHLFQQLIGFTIQRAIENLDNAARQRKFKRVVDTDPWIYWSVRHMAKQHACILQTGPFAEQSVHR
jgi:hypothetical protein